MTITKATMSEEEKINQQIWETLQDIKEEMLVTEKGQPVKYRFANIIGSGSIPAERRRKILRILQEKGAFEIQHNADGARIGEGLLFYLIINKAKFKKVYEAFRPKTIPENIEENLDYSDTPLRREYEKKWEIIKILKSHYVAKENPKLLLVWAKAFLVGEVKSLAEAASYFSVFQQAGCFKKYGLVKEGNYYSFTDFDKKKLFETYSTVEKHYKRFAAEYQKTHPPTPPIPFDWTTVSQENLILTQKVIKIILNYFELGAINRLTQTSKIPLSKFSNEQISLEEISNVLSKINGVKVMNAVLLRLLKSEIKEVAWFIASRTDYVSDNFPPEQELKTYVFLEINSFDEMRRVKNIIDAKLQNSTIPRTDKSKIMPLSQNGNYLKSVNLVSASLEPSSVIFLVLDDLFDRPIRCSVKNSKGEVAYIKKLYDIAYLVDVPGKKVDYSKNLADSINNGLFRKRQVAKYMRTNNLIKPTLVQKSEDKISLVLKNEIPVKTLLIKNIPVQHQSLYIDKTK